MLRQWELTMLNVFLLTVVPHSEIYDVQNIYLKKITN